MNSPEEKNAEWVPPPPPDDGSIFSSGTREYYADKIRKDAFKALAFGFLSIFCCPPIFAYFAWSTGQEVLANIDIYEVEEGKKGLAQAAKVLAIVGVILWVVGMIVRLSGLN